eukprot:Platyproteum_vivax@DN2836_c0_g1_i2.p1
MDIGYCDWSSLYRVSEKPIDAGAHSEVYVFRHVPSGKLCAIKSRKGALKFGAYPNFGYGKEQSAWARESRIQFKLSSQPNVVTLYMVFQESAREKGRLMLEFCGGGTIWNLAMMNCKNEVPFSVRERQLASFLKAATSALVFCHDHGIIHRDIKGENLLLVKGTGPLSMRLRIADWGSAVQEGDDGPEVVQRGCGTPGYLAPELFRKKSKVTTAVDVFSLGVISHMFASGRHPFCTSKNAPLDDNRNFALKDEVQLTKPAGMSLCLWRLLSRMLDRNYETRMTMKQVAGHPFLHLAKLDRLPPRSPFEFEAPAIPQEPAAFFPTASTSHLEGSKTHSSDESLCS